MFHWDSSILCSFSQHAMNNPQTSCGMHSKVISTELEIGVFPPCLRFVVCNIQPDVDLWEMVFCVIWARLYYYYFVVIISLDFKLPSLARTVYSKQTYDT